MRGDKCPTCNASGTQVARTEVGLVEVDCPTCYGHGVVNIPNLCTACHGTGSTVAGLFQIDCPNCQGSGFDPNS